MTEISRVELKGTPKEIGLQHGRLLKAKILRQLAFYKNLFKRRSNMDWPQVLEISQEFEKTLSKISPDLLEEISGIAEGVRESEPDIGLPDILALNCRSEIAFGKFSDGCTALGMHTSDTQILAQNWDWNPEVKDNIVLMSIERSGKPKIWMVTEAGIIGKIGFNSLSVGVCLNAIRARPMISSKPPIHILLRLVLESPSVETAIQQIEDLGCATSAHMLIADSSVSLGAEVSPLGTFVIREDSSRMVVHTNHFLLNNLVDEPVWLEDSPVRLERMRQLANELVQKTRKGSRIGLRQVRDLFRDEENPPGSICRHISELIPEMRPDSIVSLFNICMDLRRNQPKAEVVFHIGSKTEGNVLRMPW